MPTKKVTKNPKVAKKGAPKGSKATAPKKATNRRMSALNAAARVLAAGASMSTAELIEAMASKKLWQSPNGKTPAATLYAAILREITTKGADSRFQKTEPGRFAAAAGKAGTPPAGGPKPTVPKPKAKGGKKKGTEPAPAVAIPNETTRPAAVPELAGT